MDPYAPCPCGSGKKVKFCCQAILPEMARIERLQDNNQPRMALQLIDKLLKDHPQNLWLLSQRALALFNEERFADARDSLVSALRKQPDHPLANALLAMAMTQLEPLDVCKKVIHRAFLKSMTAQPALVAILAEKLVVHYLEHQQYMAARQHMALVLRLAPEEERQRILMGMLELDSDTNIPYPLRGAQHLPHVHGEGEHQALVRKSHRLSAHGCYAEAADLLDQVVQQDSGNSELQHLLGLTRAWDGDETRAALALHQAARTCADFEHAVEVEAQAQLLDRQRPENLLATERRDFDVEALSRLLTRLDNEDRLVRQSSGQHDEQHGLAATYHVLDRPQPTGSDLESLSLQELPKSLGQIYLFDRVDEEQGPTAQLHALDAEHIEQMVGVFEKAAGELARPNSQEVESGPSQHVSPEQRQLMHLLPFLGEGISFSRREDLRRQAVDHFIQEKWQQTPQAALEGLSPAQAAEREDLRVPLAAAIRVLDTFLDSRDLVLDVRQMRERLRLPAPAPLSVDSSLDLNTLSISQMQRLDLSSLSDEVFDRVMQRSMVFTHCGLSLAVLQEFVEHRPELTANRPEETLRAHGTLSTLCMKAQKRDEALAWTRRGLEIVQSQGHSFEDLAMWKLRELSLLALEPDRPEFRESLIEIWNQFGSKLPAVRQNLEMLVQRLKIDPPWESAILTPQASPGGALWTAETEQSATQEKKLWLPD